MGKSYCMRFFFCRVYYNNMNYIMLVGDFNSRSGASPDYTIADEFLSRIHDDNFLQTENAQKISTFEQCNIPLERGRTGLVIRASDSGSGDPGSILGRVGVLFP